MPTTTCPVCTEQKPDHYFVAGHRPCKTCRSTQAKANRRKGLVLCCNKLSLPGACPRCKNREVKAERLALRAEDKALRLLERSERRCPACTDMLALDQYPKNSTTLDGHAYVCTDCLKKKRAPELHNPNFTIYKAGRVYVVARGAEDLARILPVPSGVHRHTAFIKPGNTLITLTADSHQGLCAQIDKFLRYFT